MFGNAFDGIDDVVRWSEEANIGNIRDQWHIINKSYNILKKVIECLFMMKMI